MKSPSGPPLKLQVGIDVTRCMARRDGPGFLGIFGILNFEPCQEPATHNSLMGRRCARHAEELRRALRNPNTLGNILSGGRARTEEEIAKLVVELSS